MAGAKKPRWYGFLVLAIAVTAASLALGIYGRVTRPDEAMNRVPLRRVEDGVFVDPHMDFRDMRKVDGSYDYLRLMKVQADTEPTRLAIAKALGPQSQWTYKVFSTAPPGGTVGEFNYRRGGYDYAIRIQPGGSGEFTQIEEMRKATHLEVLQNSFEEFMDSRFARGKA